MDLTCLFSTGVFSEFRNEISFVQKFVFVVFITYLCGEKEPIKT